MRDLVIFINGILTRPGNAFAWTDDAVRWMNRKASDRFAADKFEYHSPALLRRLFIRGHAEDLARTISDYVSDEVPPRLHLVGHSNGCELIARAVQLTGARIASLHLISGAVERDFGKNGLGTRLARGQVGKVWCYCSHGDHVLKYLARGSQIVTFGALGYGDLGYRGPAGVEDPILNRVETHWENELGHSDWFGQPHFEATMSRLHRNLLAS
jgi:pimeloyl-ACP methyl ester carboxylesterase